MKKQTALEIICALLVLLFVYTATAKFINFSGNLHDMQKQPFQGWFARLLAFGLPPLEIITAILIIFDPTRRIGLYVYLSLMIAFTGYIAAIKLHFFAAVPCSCGGVIKYLSWTQHFFFNLFFIAFSLAALWLHKKIHA